MKRGGCAYGLAVGIVPGFARVMRMLPRVQAALAVALVVGACAAGVHAVRARSVNSGIDTTRRLTYRLALDADGNDRVAAYDLALERARGIHGVVQVAAIDALPVDGAGHDRSLVVERAAGRAHTDHACRSVSPSYFDVMGIPVLSGRSFTVRDGANDPAVAVVNDAFARRYWPDELAAGHRVGLASASGVRWLTVVGVVGNVREGGRDDAPRPEVYAPFPQLPARSLCIVATAAYGAEPAVSAGVATLEAERLSTDVRRLADVVDRPVARQTGFAVALGVLACIALGLVASGMIGGPSGGRGRVPV